MATHTPRFNLSQPENTDEMQSFMSDYANNMNIIDENLGGGGGSANIVELTQAEYDALPASKLSDDTMYLIKDANSASNAEFTHVYGLYLDTNNVIYSAFTFDDTEHSWTATSDCILTDNMWAPSNASAAFIRLNGKQVFATYDLDNPFIYVKKGQVVSYRAKSNSIMKAYGVVAGSEVTFLSEYASACYSAQEREVGCWIDGKPLYQKTLVFSNPTLGRVDNLSHNIADVDTIILDFWEYRQPSGTAIVGFEDAVLNWWGNFFVIDRTGLSYRIGQDWGSGGDLIVNVRYTKTTDVAGSGQWTPMAQPTHHYSTEEQVIGTWINNKPLYEKTFDLGSDIAISNSSWYSSIVSITNIENITLCFGLYSGGTYYPLMAYHTGDNVNVLACRANSGATVRYLTIQYTKSTN